MHIKVLNMTTCFAMHMMTCPILVLKTPEVLHQVMINLLQAHLTRLMMMPQVMYMMILPHAHLMVMMVHARAMMMMLLQTLQLHHIVSCHKVTPRYQMIIWLIMLIHMMSLLVDLLA